MTPDVAQRLLWAAERAIERLSMGSAEDLDVRDALRDAVSRMELDPDAEMAFIRQVRREYGE